MNKKFKYFVIAILVSLSVLILSNDNNFEEGTVDNFSYKVVDYETNYIQMIVNKNKVVLIELYEDNAPITVANFKKLVSEKYYDGLTFHRVIKDFMIQGGNGDNVNSIIGEFEENGYTNDIKHLTGTISMARTDEYDSASGQFFICLNDTGCSHLDGSYAAFGNVIAGMDYVSEIGLTSTDSSDKSLNNQTIKRIRFIEVGE